MGGWRRTTSCEQAGQLISLRLDGELSELEQAALDRHLDRCAHCRSTARDFAGIAQLLREAPLVQPQRAIEIVDAQRSRTRMVSRAAGVASLAGVAAVAAVLAVSSSREQKAPPSALGFRSVAEQIRFLRAEQQRLEPALSEAVYVVDPRVAVRSL